MSARVGAMYIDRCLSRIEEMLSCPELDLGLSFRIISWIFSLVTVLKSKVCDILSVRKDLYVLVLFTLIFWDRAGPISVKKLLN